MGPGLKRAVQDPTMACRFALLLDGGPQGATRALPVHLTCPACGGHHAATVTDRLPLDRPWRAAERVALSDSGEEISGAEPTHRCRDCGHAWAEGTPPSATLG
jgi:hypothetical protein